MNYFSEGNPMDHIHEPADEGKSTGVWVHNGLASYPFVGFNRRLRFLIRQLREEVVEAAVNIGVATRCMAAGLTRVG
jgi:hypothetical protein